MATEFTALSEQAMRRYHTDPAFRFRCQNTLVAARAAARIVTDDVLPEAGAAALIAAALQFTDDRVIPGRMAEAWLRGAVATTAYLAPGGPTDATPPANPYLLPGRTPR